MAAKSITTGENQPDAFRFVFVRPPNRRSTYSSTLLHAGEDRIVIEQTISPSKPLRIDDQEVMGSGYHAVWFLYKEARWDVARVYQPDGTFTGYYADILEPVRWEGAGPHTLAPIVDLFLDLWIMPDGRVTVLDEDEFEAALSSGAISPQQGQEARRTLSELLERIRNHTFPPDVVREYTR